MNWILEKNRKDQEEFDKYGYFFTGDIAIFTTDGCIKIVDRLKNLVKLKGDDCVGGMGRGTQALS